MKFKKYTFYVAMFLLISIVWNNAHSAEPLNGNATGNESIYDKLSDKEFWFFIFGCGFISILVKIVDHAIQINNTEGKQGIESFAQKDSIFEWSLWFLSASIVGFLGYLVGLFQNSAQAAVMIGLGWPTVFKQLKEKYGPESKNKDSDAQLANGIHNDLYLGEERVTSNECYDIDENEGVQNGMESGRKP
jgi:hypothetical protein